MNRPLRWAVAGLLLASGIAVADEGKPGGKEDHAEHFAAMKKQIMSEIDAEIGAMQKLKDCVSSASDHEAMKACHKQREAAMRELHKARKAHRVQEIEAQQKHLEEEKQRLQKDDEHPEPPDHK